MNRLRLVRKLRDTLTTTASDKPTVRVKVGTVYSVTAGGATDGNAQVVVTIGADQIPAPYLKSYASPAVGNTVAVLLVNSSPLILGAVIGAPTF